MKPSQKTIILSYLKQYGDWKREYEIRCLATDFGWIGARGDRDVRELIKTGKLLTDKDGKYRIVKWKPEVYASYQGQAVSLEVLNSKLKGEKEANNQKLI